MTTVINKAQFDHCPITLEKLGPDTMILLLCLHRISEAGLREYYAQKKIPYDIHTIKVDLKKLNFTCPECRAEIEDIKPDLTYRNIYNIAKEANIITNSLEDFSVELKAISNPVFEEKKAPVSVPFKRVVEEENIPGEYSIHIDEVHHARSYNVSEPHPYTPPVHVYRPQATAHMREYGFNEEHYRSRYLSYGYMTEQTEKEFDACHQGDIKNCIKLGLYSRILKAVSCCLLTPVVTTHAVGTCIAGSFAWFFAPVGIVTIFEEDSDYDCEEDCEFIKCLCTGGCTAYGYTAVLCAECWTNTMCCPVEACVPECTTRAGLPWVYKVFEKAKSVLWNWCQEVNDD
jgi:hypothetical protein